MQAGEEIAGSFFVAGRDASELFDELKETLDEVAFGVEGEVAIASDLVVRLCRDDRLDGSRLEALDEGVGVIALVAGRASGCASAATIKPKWRMRWKPSGRVCRRKRRMNSSGELHDLAGAVLAIIFPGESDVIVFDGGQAAVGDVDAVCIATEIGERLGGSTERLLCIKRPSGRAHVRDEGAEAPGIGDIDKVAEEVQGAGVVSFLQTFEEQTAEEFCERPNG